MDVYSGLFVGLLIFITVINQLQRESKPPKFPRRNLFKSPGRQLPKKSDKRF